MARVTQSTRHCCLNHSYWEAAVQALGLKKDSKDASAESGPRQLSHKSVDMSPIYSGHSAWGRGGGGGGEKAAVSHLRPIPRTFRGPGVCCCRSVAAAMMDIPSSIETHPLPVKM